MASTIQIKNSTTSGNSPSSLTTGELAINVVDGNFFYGSGSAVKQDFAVSTVSASGDITASAYSGDGSNLTGVGTVDTSGTPADSQVAVFTDADTIEGSNKLKFDSSILDIASTNSDTATIRIYGGVVGSVSPYISPFGAHTSMKFGDGTSGHTFDFQNNKIAFDSDATNTYIIADTSTPENIEIHADGNIELRADDNLEIYSPISTAITASADISSSGEILCDTIDIASSITASAFRGTEDGSGFRMTNVGGFDSGSGAFLVFGTDDLQFSTNGDSNTRLTIDSSGKSTFTGNVEFKSRELINTDGSEQYYGDLVTFGGGGTLTQGSIYYLNSSQNWALADASAASTAQGMLGIATSTGIELLVKGIARHTGWAGLGHGSVLYLSETAGELTTTKPTTSGAIVRVIGYCTNTSVREIYFNPSTDWIELA